MPQTKKYKQLYENAQAEIEELERYLNNANEENKAFRDKGEKDQKYYFDTNKEAQQRIDTANIVAQSKLADKDKTIAGLHEIILNLSSSIAELSRKESQ